VGNAACTPERHSRIMSDLKEKLKRLIETAGALTVADYMALCLFDPEAGYYTTREPFGVDGDFTTAPEVSQMFGELLAVWALSAWNGNGRPTPSMLAEIGPGRGTLMCDMLRTLNKLDTSFVILSRFAMIEASPRLAEIQRTRLGTGKAKPTWYADVDNLPKVPLILIGNELFDAIPVRQFVKTPQGWRERMVALDETGNLAFAIGMSGLDESLLPVDAHAAEDGAIFELAPARTALMDKIAMHISRHGGAALFADYGHLQPGLGDTLQAVRRHEYEGVLESPGQADLTSHVDFAALAQVARAHGLDVTLTTQGDFLLDMGLLQRAGSLGENASEDVRERIRGEVERLAGPTEMGKLFKVMVIAQKGVKLAPYLTAD
jgi:SAM-dependent MidA family methyltransferase